MEILDYILHIDKYLETILNDYQNWFYLILFLLIFIETGLVVMPFLPGDSLLFAAGMLAAAFPDQLNIYIVLALLWVAAIAGELGIKNVIAEVLPEDKSNVIKRLQAQSQTAMVGDGINDAPALAQADVGIAMGSGTDVAMESGDVVLVKGDPRDVADAIKLSKATVRKIYQNLFFSLVYNVAGIPIAAGVFAFAGWSLKPEIAGLAMALSSVSVVLNSLLLNLFKPKKA